MEDLDAVGASRAESDNVSALAVGTRLRQLRLGRRLTLKAVAHSAGVTEGFLSQVENGHSAPSMRTFRRIAAALGMDWSDVLDSDDSPLPRLVHSTGGRTLTVGTVSKFRVTPPSMTHLEILRGELEAGGSTGAGYTHGDSDEILVVLAGSVEATVADVPYSLVRGDSLCYRSSSPHSVRNSSDTPAVVLWVNSPPTGTLSSN